MAEIDRETISFASVKLLLGTKRALKVLPATSGETGIALAQTHHPKLILLDLNLPDTHGSEVIQRLQKDPATARIPVVVISGDATPSQIERLLVLGARNYLTKPFEPAPFLAVIDEVMQANAAPRAT
jgi:CheY-like chemotaxis protein